MDKLIDFIKIYDKALPDEMCDSIIKAFDKDEEHHIKSTTGEDVSDSYRNAIELNTTQRAAKSTRWKVIMEILTKLAASQFERYKHDLILNGYPQELFFKPITLEQFRMHRYDPNKHYYNEHIDSINVPSSRRMLVMLYYLNTVDKGGETVFSTLDKRVYPIKGRLLVAPTWFGYPHSGETPFTETKYMIKTYIHYPE
tara:strand:- start:1809 stop:2402 length:594 start_codon:yes stop_codon:yes gene_type:complete